MLRVRMCMLLPPPLVCLFLSSVYFIVVSGVVFVGMQVTYLFAIATVAYFCFLRGCLLGPELSQYLYHY